MNSKGIIAGGFPGATFTLASALTVALGMTWAGGPALAQSTDIKVQEAETVLEVTERDHAAAKSVTARGIHTMGSARIGGGRYAPKTFRASELGGLVEVSPSGPSGVRAESLGAAAAAVPAFSGPGFYPDDLSQNNPPGPVVTNAQFHQVFINCDGSCFGRPGVFSNRFYASEFIHVLDQYTGTTQTGRYVEGTGLRVPYNVQSAFLDDATDIAAILHTAASTFGTGYNVVYKVFVPPGIDVCISSTSGLQCFSPNNPANWTFCAYHSYVDFPDIGHVLYMVIPYPDQALISGGLPYYVCDVGQPNPNSDTAPTPNGVLIDSISSFIDHEISETITDPDLNAYQAQNSLADYLAEIGDECVNPGFIYTPFAVSGVSYYIQPEYSNTYHACVTVP
jgi:hypothetical protein